MSFVVEQANGQVHLKLDGPNAIECVAELRDVLVKCGAPCLPVVIDADKSGAIDLAVVQLLASLRSSSPEFRIERASDEFLESLDRCAVRRIFHAALKQEPPATNPSS